MSNRPLGKRRWSRFLAAISAATARAGSKSPCAEKATASVASACAPPCAAGACTPCNPRRSRPAPPIRPTGCGAPPTGCLTSPSPPRPTRSGSATSRTCRWPTATGRLPVCVSGYGQQAGGRLARTGHDARRTGHQGFTARLLGATADAGPARAFRPRRAVLRQRLPPAAPRPPGPALAEPPGRLLRQCAGGKPLVAPQNRSPRTARAARFCRPGRRPTQRRRLFDYYNHEQLHSRIGYQTPYHTHQQLL